MNFRNKDYFKDLKYKKEPNIKLIINEMHTITSRSFKKVGKNNIWKVLGNKLIGKNIV